jgi:hypothetical protein
VRARADGTNAARGACTAGAAAHPKGLL